MIFRRIKAHVEEENWFAVGIDFAIVVLGVFIGLQFGNWNDARADRSATLNALERLQSEIAANVAAADNIIASIEESRAIRKIANQSLSECRKDPSAIPQIESALDNLITDIVPAFVRNVTSEIARQDRYTAYLSNDFLNALNVYDGHVTDEADQLKVNFQLMWDMHVTRHPLVGIEQSEDSVVGSGFTLTVPMETLCQDRIFIRQFIMTNTWHESTQMRLERFKARSGTFANALEAELAALR